MFAEMEGEKMNKVSTVDALPSRIMKTPDVCGGSACVRSTRIPVWSLVLWRRENVTDPRLLELYPSLNQADLTAAWDYYSANPVEIDQDIKSNEDASCAVR